VAHPGVRDAPAPEDEERGDREHERCHGAVLGEGLALIGPERKRLQARLDDADQERGDQRDPQGLEATDESRGEGRDDDERESGRLEGVVEPREQQPRCPAHEPRDEPGGGLDDPHGHAERRRDLTIVGDRAVRGSELRVAEED
jgi:hypothetical protein